MKLNTDSIIDLSDDPSISIVTKLKKNDLIVHNGEKFYIEIPPKRLQKGIWVIGLKNDSNKKYIRIEEKVKPKMTPKEKRTMISNINGVIKMYSNNEQRMVEIVKNYYNNLTEHNSYNEKDVREIMGKFPTDILQKSGIAI